jgi:hypothetical protein
MASRKSSATRRIGGPGASHENRRQPEKSKAHAETASADKKKWRPPQNRVLTPSVNKFQVATGGGSSKPPRGSKRKDVSQDGAHQGGGINTRQHAGPTRSSKTPPTGVKGAQLQQRASR